MSYRGCNMVQILLGCDLMKILVEFDYVCESFNDERVCFMNGLCEFVNGVVDWMS